MTRPQFCLLLAAMCFPGAVSAGEKIHSPNPETVQLRERRAELNEKGNASEFAGKWRMKLPAGFEYDVTFKQEENGLLRMTCRGHALNLLGDFACVGNELRLVAARQDRVEDYIWVYYNGKFILGLDEQPFGATYRGATLTRLP